MPQFDTFSFLSQVTWTFFFFGLIFLINSYSLFPAAAAVLKTRSLKSWATKSAASSEVSESSSDATKIVDHEFASKAFLKWETPQPSAKNMFFFNILSLKNLNF
jgi:hypothetical protein|nr:orf 104 [Emiliania huxleyi]UPY85241.1 orf 104 [Gephyrocapsa ericsonii]WJW65448.1 ATPase subunit 8 [Emiliania huxleyi]